MLRIWHFSIEHDAKKQLKKLPKNIQERILDYFDDRILVNQNPFVLAAKLVTPEEELWRFRVGDYRIICKIDQNKLVVVAVAIGHRKEIYKKSNH